MRQRQRIVKRMELKSQVDAVRSHNAPVNASVRRPTPANAHYTISGDLNSSALPDDLPVFVADAPTPHHPVVPESPTDRAEDANGGGRDDGSDAAADLQRDEVSRRHEDELGRLADDRRPTPPRPRLGAGRAVVEVALLLGRRLRRFAVAVFGRGGKAMRVGNRRDRECRYLLLAANLSLLNSTTARHRALQHSNNSSSSLSSNEPSKMVTGFLYNNNYFISMG